MQSIDFKTNYFSNSQLFIKIYLPTGDLTAMKKAQSAIHIL